MFDHCVYLDVKHYEEASEAFPVQIGVAGASIDRSILVAAPEAWGRAWSPEQLQLAAVTLTPVDGEGLSAADVALTLNQELKGFVVFCETQAKIDLIQGMFAAAAVAPAFEMELLKDGWVHDMVVDYDQHFAARKAQNIFKGDSALKDASAMRYAHASMIPL
jgi:hypothetical protein